MPNAEQLIRGSLWLRPTGPVLERLQELIRRLTARFGGHWPQPHVSLLGGIELTADGAEARLAALAERLRPVPIRLGALGYRNEHFRCFFASVEPSAELLDAQRAACEIFELKPAEPYEPHLSLLYGQIDEPTKAHLAKELGGRLDLSFTATSVHLVNASAAVPVARWHSLYERALSRTGRHRPPPARALNA